MAFSYEYPYTDPERANSDWLLSTVKEVLNRVENLEEWKITHEEQYDELKLLHDQILSGNFPETVKTSFENWMKENAIDLVGQLVQNVFFGLNNDGYFVAYIPESWREIIFNTTGLDIIEPGVDYGHLVLSY